MKEFAELSDRSRFSFFFEPVSLLALLSSRGLSSSFSLPINSVTDVEEALTLYLSKRIQLERKEGRNEFEGKHIIQLGRFFFFSQLPRLRYQ